MDFVANRSPQTDAMKKELGIQDILELYLDIPEELLIKKEFKEGVSEYEGMRHLEELASKNRFHQIKQRYS